MAEQLNSIKRVAFQKLVLMSHYGYIVVMTMNKKISSKGIKGDGKKPLRLRPAVVVAKI